MLGLSEAALANPFAWGFLVAAALLMAVARRGEKGPRRRMCLGAGVLVLLLGVAEVALDKPVQAAEVCRHEGAERPTREDAFDAELGYGPLPGSEIPAAAMAGGGLDFGGVYTIDERGLRRSFPSQATESVLFFGGSFTYGLGVPDEATTAYQVGLRVADRYRCYNFGFGGYGPHQMLAALQSGRVEGIVEAPPRHAVYQLIMNHVRRACGRTTWNMHDPRYVMGTDGFVQLAGRHCDPPPEPGALEAWLRRSAIYREATRHTTNAHVDLTVAIVDTARRELESRFPGCELHVVVWDIDTWKSRRVLEQLGLRGLDTHLVSDILPGYAEDDELYCNSPDDPHPNPQAHRLLAEYIVDEIL